MAFYHMQMQQENIDTGQYQVTVSDRLNNRPIENARVRISYTGAPDSTTIYSGTTTLLNTISPFSFFGFISASSILGGYS